jgi:hypothetical protein
VNAKGYIQRSSPTLISAASDKQTRKTRDARTVNPVRANNGMVQPQWMGASEKKRSNATVRGVKRALLA